MVDISERIRNILFATDLDSDTLAELLNLHPTTVAKWLDGGPMDLGCAPVLLTLLARYPQEMLSLLSERLRAAGPAGPAWPSKIKSILARRSITRQDLIEILNTDEGVLRRIERGEKEPSSCYRVMLDLLYDQPLFFELLGWRPAGETPSEWTRRRLQKLMIHLNLSTADLAGLLGIKPASLRAWMLGTSQPGPCTSLFLDLLEFFPEEIIPLIESVENLDPASWPAARVRALREELGYRMYPFSALVGIDDNTIQNWERTGLPSKSDCPTLLYELLGSQPIFVTLLEKLRI